MITISCHEHSRRLRRVVESAIAQHVACAIEAVRPKLRVIHELLIVREHEDAGPRHAPGAARARIIGEEEEGLASDRGVGQQPAPAIAQQPGEARRASVAVVRLRVVDQEDQIRAVRAGPTFAQTPPSI